MAKLMYSLIGNQTKCGGFIRCNIFLEWSYLISVKLFDDNIDETVMSKSICFGGSDDKVGDSCIN